MLYFKYLHRGCPPLKPRLTFCLETKSKQKVQDCAHFARKTDAQLAKTVQTRSFVAQTGQFLTPTSLVFRLTGRGQSPKWKLFSGLAFFCHVLRSKCHFILENMPSNYLFENQKILLILFYFILFTMKKCQ